MQYKMQFTVLDDAVKQNRKLPEIAFFDTDGNLIHLGGGEGSGSADLMHLTELGFGSPTDIAMARSGSALAIGTPANVGSSPLGPSAQLYNDGSIYAEDDVTGAYAGFDTTGTINLSVLGIAGSALKVGDVIDLTQRFTMDAHGKMSWGDGTAEPDVVLARAYGGLAISSIDPLDPSYPAQLQLDPRGAILHQPVSSDLNAIHYSGFGDDLDWRYKMFPDGSMQWGDGIAQPDTHLTRTAPGTLEIDHILSFKGDASDIHAGGTLYWDDDWYGMVLKGRAGANDTELYVVNPDDDGQYLNVYFGGGQTHLLWAGSTGGREIRSSAQGLEISTDLVFYNAGAGPILGSTDGAYHRLVVAVDGTLSTEPVSLP